MSDVAALLELSKDVAQSAFKALSDSADLRQHSFCKDIPKELKAAADQLLEEKILAGLQPTGYPILSEESGFLPGHVDDGLRFIVDPLDGTVNFVRGLGTSNISIALYGPDGPVFGVLCSYPSGDLYWGGKQFGSFFNGRAINVSAMTEISKSVLCTGIPSRLNLDDSEQQQCFINNLKPFGKVRMPGAASLGLSYVARGAAEVYTEQAIMLWDVAAGLALVEGAGGTVKVSDIGPDGKCDVVATNGRVALSV